MLSVLIGSQADVENMEQPDIRMNQTTRLWKRFRLGLITYFIYGD